MPNDRSKHFFSVLALENILVALTREIVDGPCFEHLKFSWIGVDSCKNLFILHQLLTRFMLFVSYQKKQPLVDPDNISEVHKKCLAIDIGLPNLEKNEKIMTSHIPCMENRRSKQGIHLDCESKPGGPIAQVHHCLLYC